MWRANHVIEFSVTIKLCEDCLRMFTLNCFDVGDVSKVEFMDDMADIECLYFLVNHKPCEDILIGMTADVEVARNFFDSKGSNQSASIILLKCFFCHIILFSLIWLPQ